jgi:ClpP class serine protease
MTAAYRIRKPDQAGGRAERSGDVLGRTSSQERDASRLPAKPLLPVGGANGMADHDSDEALRAAGDAVAKEYEADVYFYSGEIDLDGFGSLAEVLTLHSTPAKKALLILVTDGGQANAAYQIASLLQSTYEQFHLYTPSYCKSAGTIIALGAHTIIMDNFSELGPLDVQLVQQTN